MKAVPPQDGLSKLQTTTDATMSDAASVTGISLPVTEHTRMTEDEPLSGLDKCIDSVLRKTLLFQLTFCDQEHTGTVGCITAGRTALHGTHGPTSW